MICPPCRGEFFVIDFKKGEPKHDDCINFWAVAEEGVIVKRPEPIRSCACQHEPSWNFSVSVKDKNEGNDGNSPQS